MPTRRSSIRLGLVTALVPCAVAGQEPVTRTQLRANGVELSVGGRVQTQLNTTSIENEPPSQLILRRARLEVGIRVDERISGVLHPEFANDGVELKDAYLKFAFSPAVQFLAGQAYRPFGLLEQTSSKRILPIERGLRIRGLDAVDGYDLVSGLGYSNRDVGLQVLGMFKDGPGSVAYAAGVFRGPLHGEVGNQDTYQVAVRVTGSLAKALRVGAGWSSRAFARGISDSPELARGNAFEVDLAYGSFAPGVHVLAELSYGDIDPFIDATFRAAQTWLAYRTREIGRTGAALEPIFRISYAATGDPEAVPVVPGGTLVTPGINVYSGPLNRIMVNYDVWLGGDGSRDANSFKVMFQLGF